MRLRPSLLLAVLTLWFALLQSIAPLLHTHLNGENALDDGPHMHMAELHLQQEEARDSHHAFHWHIHANQSPGMTLGLTPALTEQGWQLPDSQPVWLIWIMLPLTVWLLVAAIHRTDQQRWPHLQFRRPHSVYFNPAAPRAPPCA